MRVLSRTEAQSYIRDYMRGLDVHDAYKRAVAEGVMMIVEHCPQDQFPEEDLNDLLALELNQVDHLLGR